MSRMHNRKRGRVREVGFVSKIYSCQVLKLERTYRSSTLVLPCMSKDTEAQRRGLNWPTEQASGRSESLANRCLFPQCHVASPRGCSRHAFHFSL